MHVAWACAAPKTSASQAVSTNKAKSLRSNFGKDGGVKLATEIIDFFCKKISKEISTIEREMDASRQNICGV